MDERGFRGFLTEGKRVPRNLSEKTIRSHIRLVKEFEAFLSRGRSKKTFEDATGRDVKRFTKLLSKDGRNTFVTLIGLLRYARFSGNEDVELAMLVMLDGGNIFGLMSETFKKEYGRKRHRELLGDFVPPPIGTPPKAMPKVTCDFMNRLETGIGQEATRALLLTGPHAGAPEYYAEERKLLKASRDVDEYLKKRRVKFVKELRGYMETDTLFFTQRIDKDALEFVKRNPEIAGGVRKGNKIYCTKVPYMMIEYLKEKDPKLRRYYYCHCPLARESILSGRKISRNFCYCSAGYEKRPFDVAFGKPLMAEVLQSVLWGDPVCRFAIEIPQKSSR